MIKQLDMENRDPNGMNSHVQVMFDDVLAEAEGAHSADCVWRNSQKCFNGGQGCCYKFLTYICGLPTALYWGCFFACIAFTEVWCKTPIIRAYSIWFHSYRKIQAIILNACLAPFMEALGMVFSRIQITNSQSDPPLPLGSIDKHTFISTPATQVKRMK